MFFILIKQNIFFEQDNFSNILLSSYGLKEVTLSKDIKTKTVLENKRLYHPKLPFLPKRKNKENQLVIESSTNQNKVWRYIAAACLLPITFYSF